MAISTNAGGTLITGDDIPVAHFLAVKGAVKLQARGMSRRGKSALTIAKECGYTDQRTAQAAYDQMQANWDAIFTDGQ